MNLHRGIFSHFPTPRYHLIPLPLWVCPFHTGMDIALSPMPKLTNHSQKTYPTPKLYSHWLIWIDSIIDPPTLVGTSTPLLWLPSPYIVLSDTRPTVTSHDVEPSVSVDPSRMSMLEMVNVEIMDTRPINTDGPLSTMHSSGSDPNDTSHFSIVHPSIPPSYVSPSSTYQPY